MRLDRLPGGIRIFEDEEVYLDLKMEQYEDIFYAIPLDNQSLFMLVNDTVLKEADDRAILSFIIEANGGVESAMARLQDLVKVLDPKEGEGVKVDTAVTRASPETAKAEPFKIDDVDQPESVETLPMEEDDEPFEAVVQPVPKTPAPTPRPPVAPTPKTPAAMPTPRTPAGIPTPKTPKPVAGGGSPGTRRFEAKPVQPVEIVFNETGKRVRIKCGTNVIDIDVVRYEDLHFACPGDNATIFRLFNDTILARPEEREHLKDILGLLGGIEFGMTKLQEAIAKAPPPKRATSRPPLPGGRPASKPPAVPVAPVVGGGGMSKAAAGPGLVKPPVAPLSKPGVPAPGPGIARPAAGPAGTPGVAKPAAGPGIAKPPAVAPLSKPGAAPAAKGPVPGAKPPAGPRPFTVQEDEVELVDDVEEIPTAPVEGVPGKGPPPVPVKPAGPVSKPGVPPPAAKGPATAAGPAKPGAPPVPAGPASRPGPALSAAQRKKKPIERPAGVAEVKMSKEEVERTGVKIKALPGGAGFQIICREYYIQLSKTQYQELHYALPMAVMNMFKLIHNDLLKDPQSRGVLMKMIHLAGGPKDFMAALSVQVKAISPTENWQ
jgi:hypothetical protein